MNIFKKFLVGVCASLLVFTLFGFGLVWSITQVAGKPDSIKSALKESGIYENGIANALDQAFKDKPSREGEGIPIDDPKIREVVTKALPPASLQAQAESALDSVYTWITGESKQLALVIDMTETKQRLADGMATYAEEKVASLPACPGSTNPNDFDPFKATCAPAGINKADIGNKMRDEILKGEFLKETKFDVANQKMDNGKTVGEAYSQVPEIYQKIQWVIMGLGAVILLLVVSIVFLSVSRRSGVRKVAITLISIGALTAVGSWVSGILLHKLVATLGNEGSKEPLQQTAARILELISTDFRTWWIGYGIVLAAVGVGALIALYFVKARSETAEALSSSARPPAEKIERSDAVDATAEAAAPPTSKPIDGILGGNTSSNKKDLRNRKP